MYKGGEGKRLKRLWDNDRSLLLLFFLLGLGAVMLGERFLAELLGSVRERMTGFYLLLPSLCALLAGSTVWGLCLIPSAAFVLGAMAGLCSFRCLLQDGKTGFFTALPAAVLAIPGFFLIGTLGMRNASVLLQALRLSGRKTEREAIRAFAVRWAIFTVILLCFLFMHSVDHR